MNLGAADLAGARLNFADLADAFFGGGPGGSATRRGAVPTD